MTRTAPSMVGRVNVTLIGSPGSGASSLLARMSTCSFSSSTYSCSTSTCSSHPQSTSSLPARMSTCSSSTSSTSTCSRKSSTSSHPPSTEPFLPTSTTSFLPAPSVPPNTVFTCSTMSVELDSSHNPFLTPGVGSVEVVLRNSSIPLPAMRALCLADADAVVVCVTADRVASLVEVWSEWRWDLAHSGAPVILALTKVDLRDGSHGGSGITRKEGLEMAKHIDALAYVECSARTNEGVKELADVAAKIAVGHAENKIKIQRRLNILNDRADCKNNKFRKLLSVATKLFRKRRNRFEKFRNSFCTDSFSSSSSNWSRSSSITW